MTLDSVSILGIPVSLLDSYEHAVDHITGLIKQKQKTFCVAINPEKVYRAQTDPELKQLLHEADMHICDRIGVAMAARTDISQPPALES